MSVIRYNIIPFQVVKPGEIISFQHKIPNYFKRCIGFKTTLVKGLNSKSVNCEVGRLSASFNSLKEEAITCSVLMPAEETQEFQDLDISLHPGQIVSGVYVDTLLTENFLPYMVNLYLCCTDKLVEPNKTEEICLII